MTKISHFLKTIVCIMCLTAQINNASAQWYPGGSVVGDGTENNPWQITTIEYLMELAAFVNAGYGSQTAGVFYKLMNDVTDYLTIGTATGWVPIGNNAISGAVFQGNFDGNGKKVSNIRINQSTTSCIGLFGYVYEAHIHDTEVEVYQAITGDQYVGALIGIANNSTIENCYATGKVVGNYAVGGLIGVNFYSTIRDCYAICNVRGYIMYGGVNTTVGGFIGMNIGTVSTSYADGGVTATGNEAGGFAGTNNDFIINCYAVGNVTGEALFTGGFVGANKDDGRISACYATGNITTTGDFIGGLVGMNSKSAIIRNCVAANDTVAGGISNANRIAGGNTGTLSHNYAYNGMTITPSGGDAGISATMDTLMSFNFYNTGTNWFDDKPWSIDTDDNPLESWKICDGETLPFLQWAGIECNTTDPCNETHAGTLEDPFLICTVQDLVDFSTYVNSGGATIGKYWKMMNDLDLAGINFNPIGNYYSYYFKGHFDGNGKVISNLTINKGAMSYVGLFGSISNAEIKNLGIEVCQIIGNESVGTLVGTVLGISTIEDCYVIDGIILGYRFVGGLIGFGDYYSNLTIENCDATGSVTGIGDAVGGLVGCFCFGTISNSYAICEVSGFVSIGGLVGSGGYESIIDKSYASGNVQSTYAFAGGLVGGFPVGSYFIITDCFATGYVTVTGTSRSYIGGLVGNISSPNGDIINCFATGNITGIGTSNSYFGGLTGNNLGSIINCYAIGDIVTDVSNYYIGGLVGSNQSNSNITNCYATGKITGSGGTYLGGLVGYNSGTIRNCVAANNTVAGGVSNINRIVGFSSFINGTLSNNYAYEDMLVNGSTVVGGTHNNDNGESMPMDTLISFNFYNTGSNWYNNIPWDIDAAQNPSKIWQICDGETLPFLQWEGLSCGKQMSLIEKQEKDYIAEQNGKSTFSIYPNPSSSHITISSEKHFHIIEIIDLLGRTVHSQHNNGNNTINVSGFRNGIYFVCIMTENGAEVQKFVKK